MKFIKYLQDKGLIISLYLLTNIFTIFMLSAFKTDKNLILAILFIYITLLIIIIILDFNRKRNFYNEVLQNIERLDQKYLILETIERPNFYEGKILHQIIYEANKSMIEKIKIHKNNIDDFKEYIEMWIHEVKLPIVSLILLCHNNKEVLDKDYLHQLRRLDNYIDQVLYYVRSSYAEEDFLIKETFLDKVISNIALKNKDDLLENKIDLTVDVKKIKIHTDSKWLEFIINQIINNSIKYKKENIESYIKIYATEDKNQITLHIKDNVIGIPKQDIHQVFKKSFTGENGRGKVKSTGIGLYIADKLCKKLGHKIEIESIQNNFTEVKITFGKNNYYKIKE